MLSRLLPRASSVVPSTGGQRRAAYQSAVINVLLGLVPVLITLVALHAYFHHGHIDALDFHQEFWPASQRVLHGLSPYDRSWMNIRGWIAYPYPAFTAIAFVPLALLNHALADWVFTAISIAAALLTLRVLQVRDWRLYGLVLIWGPVINGWQNANLTLVLGLGIAYLWRKRDNPLIAGALVAAMISLKPFVWPLGLWLLATRRYRALIYGAAFGLTLNVASWAIIGFNQIHAYSQVVSAVNNVMDKRGYSIFSLVMRLGGSHGLAYALGITAAAAAAIACLIVGRRGNTKSALALSIAVCLLATPVLWTHYFALLIVPLAIFRPRLDPLWLLPLIMWLCPANRPAAWQIIIAVGTGSIVLGLLLRPRLPPASREHDLAAAPILELDMVT
jgi:hypothetical protein